MEKAENEYDTCYDSESTCESGIGIENVNTNMFIHLCDARVPRGIRLSAIARSPFAQILYSWRLLTLSISVDFKK